MAMVFVVCGDARPLFCATHGLFTLVLLYSAELGAVQSQRIHVEIVLLTVRFRDVMDSVRSRFL